MRRADSTAAGKRRSQVPEKNMRSAAAVQQADFSEYEQEDRAYHAVIDELERNLDFGLPIRASMLVRSELQFWPCEVVVVVGQDGLVANTAKYVGNLPIVAINPDPQRIDGILLPFHAGQARAIVRRVLDGQGRQRLVTLAEAELNDGQKMLAFNDFFVGAASHVSARYLLEAQGRTEPQSSSGILVSTGAGSTGWLSSVFNMAGGVSRFLARRLPDRPSSAGKTAA